MIALRRLSMRLRRAVAFRLVPWAMNFAQGSAKFCGNRVEFSASIDGQELFVRVRDLRKPSGYERTEVLEMLRSVRMHEARSGWTCPDPGKPKRGQLVYDGETVDVLYFWEEPDLSDGPWDRLQCAREVVGVTEDGRRRVLKQRGEVKV